MKTGVRESSIDCYHGHIVGSIEPDQSEIVAASVKRLRHCTRRMIARDTGIETSTVSARVNKLIADGLLIECEERERAPCPITGKLVYWITHRDNAKGQVDLFGGVLQ